MNATGSPMSRAETVLALQRLRTEREKMSAALLDLERHPRLQPLADAELTGETRERWERARDLVRDLRHDLARYVDVLGWAEALHVRDPRPGSADAAELHRLLFDAVVEVPRRGAPSGTADGPFGGAIGGGAGGPSGAVPHGYGVPGVAGRELVTLDGLMARMNAAHAQAAGILTEIDTAWSVLLPALDRAEEAARAVQELLDSLPAPAPAAPAAPPSRQRPAERSGAGSVTAVPPTDSSAASSTVPSTTSSTPASTTASTPASTTASSTASPAAPAIAERPTTPSSAPSAAGSAAMDRKWATDGRDRGYRDRPLRELATMRRLVKTDPLFFRKGPARGGVAAGRSPWSRDAAGRVVGTVPGAVPGTAIGAVPGTGPIPAAGPETAADGAAIHIDTGRLDRITDELAVLHGELQAAARIRDDYDVRVAALTALVDRIATAQEEALRARERVRVRVARVTLPEVPDLAGPLRDRLASLAQLHRQRRWVDLAKRIGSLETVADDALEQMCAMLGAVMAPLHRRDELRGRLEAYAVKAARLGHADDEELTELYRRSRELLWTAPCDLREATAAVRLYQEAIGRRQKSEWEPGGP